MTESNNSQKKWWIYVNNTKLDEPITMDDVKKFCNQSDQFNFKLLSYLLIKGASIKSSLGRIRLKKVSQTDLTQQSLSEAL